MLNPFFESMSILSVSAGIEQIDTLAGVGNAGAPSLAANERRVSSVQPEVHEPRPTL